MKKLWKPIAVAGLSLVCLSACSTKLTDLLKPLTGSSSTVASSTAASSVTKASSSVAVATLSQEEAGLKALEAAGFTSAEEVEDLKVTAATFNSKPVFDVTFSQEGVEYSYTVDGQTGELVDKEAPASETTTATQSTTAAQPTAEATATVAEETEVPADAAVASVSVDQALASAFTDFGPVYGVTSADVANLTVDQAAGVYRISFDHVGVHFIYDVDATTGAILGFSEN